MSRSPFFNPYSEIGQQELYRNLVNECVNLFGLQITYIPRQSVAGVDMLLGDDPTAYFRGTFLMQMYLENVEAFDGPQNVFTKFGLVINKEARLLVANDEFNYVTSGSLGSRPREGDLIWLPPFKALHEITFVQQDKFFYAFGRQNFYGFELMTEEFRYNNEQVITTNPEITELVNNNQVAYQANVNVNGTLTYTLGEEVYQGNNVSAMTANATVVSWNKPNGVLVLAGVTGNFLTNVVIVGANSNAQYVLIDMDMMNDVNEPLDNSIVIRETADEDLDTSESNPMGNPVLSEDEES